MNEEEADAPIHQGTLQLTLDMTLSRYSNLLVILLRISREGMK